MGKASARPVNRILAPDRAVLQQIKQFGTKPLTIFDVGANRGQSVDLVLKQFSAQPLVIHAFEPSQAAFADLARRFTDKKGLVLNNLALGSETGQQTLYFDVAGSELSSLYPRRIEHHGIQMTGSELVNVETLDRYCAAHDVEQIDLLKLDVEGHELAVLQGATQMFDRKQVKLVEL